ncbi:hypothetical protein AL492_17685 [Elizabethkingia anophelis]|uniref:hypothetical protein n=1 Tax=Elizabethkingia anophelis TaxID=1117645 RepID=UPI000CE9A1BF|nr:hypothetical protein [Elizabethkingia anophelis]AVF49355.1 hypothetical protein AL491_15280 [Elizabethkingia anophelis]AVF53350.1 hypothetical protein AL492_17685 [Elizabethkingia anophelis]
MIYTVADGRFYKVTDKDGRVEYFKLEGTNEIATAQKVEIITEAEYNSAKGIEIAEVSELNLPDPIGPNTETENKEEEK